MNLDWICDWIDTFSKFAFRGHQGQVEGRHHTYQLLYLRTEKRTDAPFSSFPFFSWNQEDAPGLQPLQESSLQEASINQPKYQTDVTQEDAHNLEKETCWFFIV